MKRSPLMRKPAERKVFAFRIISLAVVCTCVAALGLSASGVLAQTWTEPSLLTPPNGNVAPPIWNQTAADQSASFRISGNGLVGGNLGVGTTNPANGRLQVGDSEVNSGVGNFNSLLTIQGNASTSSLYLAEFRGHGLAYGTTIDSNGFISAQAYGITTWNRIEPMHFYQDASNLLSWSNVVGNWAATADLGISRYGAGVLALGNGTANDYGGTLIAGKVGIGINNPSYPLDVSGTVNALATTTSGVQGTSTSGYGVYGTSDSGAGIGGVSTSGYGVYGSSSGSYAGYFNGTLNATGAITQNGVSVCLSDGTNCASSGNSDSSFFNMRSTRTSVAYNATLATKDAQCVTEFGADYQAASYPDALAYYGKAPLMSGFYTRADSNWTCGNVSIIYNLIGLINESNSVFRWQGYVSGCTDNTHNGYQKNTVSNGTLPVLCVNKKAPVLVSRTAVAYNATLATKDAQCVTEYGSSYQAAGFGDFLYYMAGSIPVTYRRPRTNTSYSSDMATENMGLTATASTSAQWYTYSYNNQFPNNDQYGWREYALSSGNLGVICARK